MQRNVFEGYVEKFARKASIESGDGTERELVLLLCLQLGFELIPSGFRSSSVVPSRGTRRTNEDRRDWKRFFNFFLHFLSRNFVSKRVQTCSDGDELLLSGVVLKEGQELSLESLVKLVFDGLFDVSQTNGGRGHLLVTTFGQDEWQTTFQKLGELCDDWVSQCWSHCWWWWVLFLLWRNESRDELCSVDETVMISPARNPPLFIWRPPPPLPSGTLPSPSVRVATRKNSNGRSC